MAPDVMVVGGGVIGASIAFHCQKSGLSVLVCDRGVGDGQASAASAGLLAPLADSEPGVLRDLARESFRLFRPLADELRERTGLDIGYRTSGLIRIALSEDEEQELRRRWERRDGAPAAWLDSVHARLEEPALSPRVRAAVLYLDEHQVTAPDLTRALLRASADLGAVIRQATVDRLLQDGDRVVGVQVGGEALPAGEVVLANGAWASAWAEALRLSIPIRPVRGQAVGLRTVGKALRHIVDGDRGYIAEKADGLIYVGATREEAGYDAGPTPEGVSGLLTMAGQVLPGLLSATFSHAWAGLRPATPDNLPLLGRIPGWEGVSIAAGHFRQGIMLAPLTGELIRDLLRHGRTRLPIDALAPGRFLARVS